MALLSGVELRFIAQAETCFWIAKRLRGTGRACVGVVCDRLRRGELGGGVCVGGFGFAQGAELLHLAQDGLEVLQRDAIGEIAGRGGGAAVSELCLDCAEIVGCVPDIFGESAAEIVNAELGANSGALLQSLPLLGETRCGSGRRAGVMRAEQVNDRLLAVDILRELLDDFRDGGADGKRLVHVALGVERQRAEVAVVVGGADFRGGAMAQAEIGAEEQEETEVRLGGFEDLPALFVGGDGGARLRLVDARDGVADGERSDSDAFEPAEKTAQTLRVSRARVLRELRRLPGGGGALDVISGELRGRQLAEVG